jgi:3-hydroxyacyl-[acyl-carrier-protein] dehydratase
MSTTVSETDLTELKEALKRCSSETIEAAIRFRQQGDATAVPTIVYGILERYQPATATVRLASANEETRLIEDLGLDSLTLLEIVLSIEEVLKMRIENEELKGIRTLGQLNKFLQEKISGVQPAPATTHYRREHIAMVLPQQPPFMFLDEAELNGEMVKARYTIKGDEAFLEGHFKDDPVFPASIVFEALGQAGCLWLLEKAPALLSKEIKSNQVLFASMDGAHFYRKTKPGERLDIEQKLVKLREPLAIFEGSVTTNGERVARVEKLVLAFGDGLLAPPAPAATAAPAASDSTPPQT